jgi:antibiotic biosynthesis monooxygenase (ABM) superfamily enzyme
LIDREDFEGFKLWLDALEVPKGSPRWNEALAAWEAKLAEKRARKKPS